MNFPMSDFISSTISLQRFSHFPVFSFLRTRANVHASRRLFVAIYWVFPLVPRQKLPEYIFRKFSKISLYLVNVLIFFSFKKL